MAEDDDNEERESRDTIAEGLYLELPRLELADAAPLSLDFEAEVGRMEGANPLRRESLLPSAYPAAADAPLPALALDLGAIAALPSALAAEALPARDGWSEEHEERSAARPTPVPWITQGAPRHLLRRPRDAILALGAASETSIQSSLRQRLALWGMQKSSEDPASESAWLPRIRACFARGDFGQALSLAELWSGAEPNQREARRYIESSRRRLELRYRQALGGDEICVEVQDHSQIEELSGEEQRWLEELRAAGGVTTLREILDRAGPQRVEILERVTSLAEMRCLRLSPPREA